MHKHLKTLKKMTKSRRRNKSANTSEIMNYPSTAEDFRRLHPELYNKLYDDDAPMPLDPKTKRIAKRIPLRGSNAEVKHADERPRSSTPGRGAGQPPIEDQSALYRFMENMQRSQDSQCKFLQDQQRWMMSFVGGGHADDVNITLTPAGQRAAGRKSRQLALPSLTAGSGVRISGAEPEKNTRPSAGAAGAKVKAAGKGDEKDEDEDEEDEEDDEDEEDEDDEDGCDEEEEQEEEEQEEEEEEEERTSRKRPASQAGIAPLDMAKTLAGALSERASLGLEKASKRLKPAATDLASLIAKGAQERPPVPPKDSSHPPVSYKMAMLYTDLPNRQFKLKLWPYDGDKKKSSKWGSNARQAWKMLLDIVDKTVAETLQAEKPEAKATAKAQGKKKAVAKATEGETPMKKAKAATAMKKKKKAATAMKAMKG